MKMLTLAMALTTAFAACALDLNEIGMQMQQRKCYSDSCLYQILLPSHNDPVSYRILLQSDAAVADSLAPCSYIISWDLYAPAGLTSGFSAYFDGAHYRFSNLRLQEYHFDRDAVSFAPSGKAADGVQCKAQFVDMLPQFMGRHFIHMASDSSYSYTVRDNVRVAGRQAVCIEGVRRVAGYDAVEFRYILDAASLMPVEVELENNPGQIGEQTITVSYGNQADITDCTLNLESLMASHGEAFEKYRTESYFLENLVGQYLPTIALPTVSGERFIHHKGDRLDAMTIMAFVDSRVGTTADLIPAVRRAVEVLPMNIRVLWIFTDRRAEDVEAVTGPARPEETIIINAGAAVRDCGVGAVTPELIFVSADGIVRDFVRGFNQDFESIVIEKSSTTNAGL